MSVRDAFGGWLRDRADQWAGDIGRRLKIMYRVDGSSDLAEETLDHFEGWRGSRPVRIGNGAADQLQLDIYGEAMDAMYLADTQGVEAAHQGWLHITRMIDWVCDNWDQPDEGTWETRGGRKDFTYGRQFPGPAHSITQPVARSKTALMSSLRRAHGGHRRGAAA